jgi:hypothetical protein
LVGIKDSNKEHWDWVNTISDSEISETLILFDPPLNLKQQRMVHYILEKLHKVGARYCNFWGGHGNNGMPIMKYKTKLRFGKLIKQPIFYRNGDLHNTKGKLHYLIVDHDNLLEIGKEPPRERWISGGRGLLDSKAKLRGKDQYKTFNAYELFF